MAKLCTRAVSTFTKLQPFSAAEALAIKSPTAASLRKYMGEESLQTCLGFFITQAAEFYGGQASMNDMQVSMTVQVLVKKYPAFTLADFAAMTRRGMMQEYGAPFGKLSPNNIIQWADRYAVERFDIAEQESYNRARGIRQAEHDAANGVLPAEVTKEQRAKVVAFAANMQRILAEKDAERRHRKTPYLSLADYCARTKTDYLGLTEQLEAAWLDDYDAQEIDHEVFLWKEYKKYRAAQWLFDKNAAAGLLPDDEENSKQA